MDPTTILIAALAVAGYFFFVKDDKGGGGGHGGRHGGHGGHGGSRHGRHGQGQGGREGGGAPAGPRAPAGAAPLLDQMDAMIKQAVAVEDVDDSVSAIKLVGEFGVSQLGPAIDRQTQGRSKALTSAAAQDNEQIQLMKTSHAGLYWAATVLFPALAIGTITSAIAESTIGSASSNDKMKASGLIRAMYEKYSTALQQFGPVAPPPVVVGPSAVTGARWPWGYATGIGTIIPSQYKRPAGCGDAVSSPQMCASVAGALARETDPTTLRTLAASVAAAGFPSAANLLLSKADSLG